jgi:hypothetical protein
MMKTITLLKDLETPTAYHKAGETVEVDEPTYDWLMAQYMIYRAQQVADMLAGGEKLKQWGVTE